MNEAGANPRGGYLARRADIVVKKVIQEARSVGIIEGPLQYDRRADRGRHGPARSRGGITSGERNIDGRTNNEWCCHS